jgi:hypothetical protein
MIDAPGSSREAVEGLAAWALEHCPVTDTIARAVQIWLELREVDRASGSS